MSLIVPPPQNVRVVAVPVAVVVRPLLPPPIMIRRHGGDVNGMIRGNVDFSGSVVPFPRRPPTRGIRCL